MRLIDADALMNERGMCEDCNNCKHDSRLCQYNQDYSRMDICGMLTDAPTIAAIPVEWLRTFDLYYNGVSGGTPFMNALVEAWKREQEAR